MGGGRATLQRSGRDLCGVETAAGGHGQGQNEEGEAKMNGVGDMQREALERRRVDLELPQGGSWFYHLSEEAWNYRWDNSDGGWSIYSPKPRRRVVEPVKEGV